jgi:hypothetical protein
MMNLFFILFFSYCLFLFSSLYVNGDCFPPNKHKLKAIYDSLDGKNWKNKWDITTDPCDNNWYGVICDTPGYVIALNLSSNNLKGDFPNNEILNNLKIESLDISHNLIGGNLSNLKELKNLRYFDISHNLLNCEIPEDEGNWLPNLRIADFSYNQLKGRIPDSIWLLKSIQVLILKNNNLIGSLLDTIRNAENLMILDVSNNKLSGDFPENEIEDLDYIKMICIENNSINNPDPGTFAAEKIIKASKKCIDKSNKEKNKANKELEEWEKKEQIKKDEDAALAAKNKSEKLVANEKGDAKRLSDVEKEEEERKNFLKNKEKKDEL